MFWKIAYEITIYHHGVSVLSDETLLQLRNAINERNINAQIAGKLNGEDEAFSEIPFPENSHVVILCKDACYIKLFSMSATIKVVSEKSQFILPESNWVVFWFDYIKRSNTVELFWKYLSRSP